MDVLQGLVLSERAVEEVLGGLDVVRSLLSNIAKKPGEAKFRRVRKGNARIKPLLGHAEEGLLRAAGFCDDSDCEDALVCGVADHAAPQEVTEVLGLTDAACSALREQLQEPSPAAASGGTLRCRDAAVVQALECALLDHVGQRSAEQAEVEKRQRRAKETEAVHSPRRWRNALSSIGGDYLCDGGPLESWLDQDAQHRSLAHDLLQLQGASVRWYGYRAQLYCEDWRRRLRARAGAPAETFAQALSEELNALREALFEFPDRPGALPTLFQQGISDCDDVAAGEEEGEDMVNSVNDCTLVQVLDKASSREVVATVVAVE